MVQRKESEVGSARFHKGAPCNQPFNVYGEAGKKRKTRWKGYNTAPVKKNT